MVKTKYSPTGAEPQEAAQPRARLVKRVLPYFQLKCTGLFQAQRHWWPHRCVRGIQPTLASHPAPFARTVPVGWGVGVEEGPRQNLANGCVSCRPAARLGVRLHPASTGGRGRGSGGREAKLGDRTDCVAL